MESVKYSEDGIKHGFWYTGQLKILKWTREQESEKDEERCVTVLDMSITPTN